MLTVEVSTHPREADRFVRLTTDRGIVTLPLTKWAFAISHPGQCSPSGQPVSTPPGGTPVAERMAA